MSDPIVGNLMACYLEYNGLPNEFVDMMNAAVEEAKTNPLRAATRIGPILDWLDEHADLPQYVQPIRESAERTLRHALYVIGADSLRCFHVDMPEIPNGFNLPPFALLHRYQDCREQGAFGHASLRAALLAADVSYEHDQSQMIYIVNRCGDDFYYERKANRNVGRQVPGTTHGE